MNIFLWEKVQKEKFNKFKRHFTYSCCQIWDHRWFAGPNSPGCSRSLQCLKHDLSTIHAPWGGIFSPFMQIYILRSFKFTLIPGLSPYPPPPQSQSQHRSQTAIGQKKVSSHCLVYNIDKLYVYTVCIGTEREAQAQTHLFNIWTIGAMDRTWGQPQVKLCQRQCVAGCWWDLLSLVGDHILQELNTLFLTRFRTYKIARPSQTIT